MHRNLQEIGVQDYRFRFRELVEAQLPDDARILMPRSGADLVILVTWRWCSDPRLRKRSCLMRIVISEEALQKYAAGNERLRAMSDTRCVIWLRSKLASFDPAAEAQVGIEPPAVTWTLDSVELNG